MKIETTIENMTEHAYEMAMRFEISLILDPALERRQGYALVVTDALIQEVRKLVPHKELKSLVVYAPPIDDETSYVVVMHELGHHLAPNGRGPMRRPKNGCHPRERHAFLEAKLIAERAAWDWAQHYVEMVFPWTAAMEMTKQYALGTYIEGRRRVR